MVLRKTGIPRAFKKLKGERIELRFPPINSLRLLTPHYDILSAGEGGTGLLVRIYAKKSSEGNYVVERVFGFPENREDIVARRDNLQDANSLARITAEEIAMKIAKANKIPLENTIYEDVEKVDDLKVETRMRKVFGYDYMFLFTLSTLAGLALTLYSSNTSLTGHAISNTLGTTNGLLGIFLFVFGLAGLVFSFRKK